MSGPIKPITLLFGHTKYLNLSEVIKCMLLYMSVITVIFTYGTASR